MKRVTIWVMHHTDSEKDSRTYTTTTPPDLDWLHRQVKAGYRTYQVDVDLPHVDPEVPLIVSEQLPIAAIPEVTL